VFSVVSLAMRISPTWLHEFVELKVSNRQLADDLTLAGIAVESVREMDGQTLFEMEIGTNRPDAMCHYGVARECSAIYDITLKPIAAKVPAPLPAAKPFPIRIEDPAGCGRYTARVIRNVKIAPSPPHILERLKIDDHGGVSNAVDASNYTLMEMGHPTHPFDLDKLEGGMIIVRRARPGETLKTLDGVDRKLDPEDLIIADAVRPVGLAGIMGGLDSAISDSTKNILIESAWFDPASVRKTARRLGMHTDASHIFERGADWGNTALACDRVAELILQNAGGSLEGDAVDAIARHPVRHQLYLRRSEILRHLGQDIPDTDVTRMLRRLGFSLRPVSSEVLKSSGIPPVSGGSAAAVAEDVASWTVELPTWRLDVEREIDLIEEIARIYGYNRFANTLPAFSGGVVEQPHATQEAKVRATLLALGYNEAISPTFVSPADARNYSGDPPVPLANPLSEEQSMMRTSLAPGMLQMLVWNLNRGTSDVRLFEMGHIFSAPKEEQADERKMLCLGVTGNVMEAGVHGTRAFNYFDLKGDVETLLRAFEIRDLHFGPAEHYHPGRSAQAVADGRMVARFGQVHPNLTAKLKMKQDIYLAEIDLHQLLQFPLRVPRYQPLFRFPAVDRDFSFIFGDAVTFERIEKAVMSLKVPELQSFKPVEIFRGGAFGEDKYSVLLRAQFQSYERTLRDDEVALWSAQIIKVLEAIGGSLRA
jgi:phenylalanyl-tRNA synthetase beta chain